MWYRFVRPGLFLLPPEWAHQAALTWLRWRYSPRQVKRAQDALRQLPKTVFQQTVPNPIGLAAGFDKNGDVIDASFGLGFGFIEIGAVTPRPQPGNPKPRLFRLTRAQALINRFGFNNRGVDYVVERLRTRRVAGMLGVNLGKNADTPLEFAGRDYAACFEKVYPYADFVTVNISSPNTQSLRELQEQTALTALLSDLKATQARCRARYQREVPLLVKISPDLSDEALIALCEVLITLQIDGVVAVNTTLSRTAVPNEPLARQAGGLSGKPLLPQTLHVVRRLAELTQKRLVIIGVGGVSGPEDAKLLLEAGADLVQLYTALVYQGPSLVRRIINHL